jgi:diamine N-acetyltransferase
MIDKVHQGNGYAFAAMQIVIDFARCVAEARELFTSFVLGPSNPSPLYRKLGFEDTGQMLEGEKVMHLRL